MFKTILDKNEFSDQISKVVCVGRNYAEHAKELNNEIPSAPILFIKPPSSVVDFSQPLVIPQDQGSVHHELEIAILIGQPLSHASEQQVVEGIAGVGLALDLTLRDVQSKLKEKGHPWERAKSFDGACPLSEFISLAGDVQYSDIALQLIKNEQLQQQGNSAQMLFAVLPLIAEISRNFSLQAGDVILTGTPAGVGPLISGDQLQAQLNYQQQSLSVKTEVL